MPDSKVTPAARRPFLTGAAFAAALAVASAALAGWDTPPVPARPNLPVDLPAPPPPAAAPASTIPAELLKPGATVTLAQVVDVALQNNPLTRTSYLLALSAAAQLGSKRAPYYPSVDVAVSWTRTNQLSQDPSVLETGDSYGPSVAVKYLLLDMGGRSANADDARY
ncbi:MAG: TolC family protein, partial [Myxococcaceae bacterium]